MGTLLARNATILVTMDDQRRELPGAGLFARDGVIEQVGPSAELPSDADVVLELTGHLLLPGLVNCHHHLDQVLTRNLPAGQNTNLFPWLRAHYRLWGRRAPRRAPAGRLCGGRGRHPGRLPARDRALPRLQGGLDVPDRAGALLAVLRDAGADAELRRSGPPVRRTPTYPPGRDARRGALHAGDARPPSGRLPRIAGLGG